MKRKLSGRGGEEQMYKIQLDLFPKKIMVLKGLVGIMMKGQRGRAKISGENDILWEFS